MIGKSSKIFTKLFTLCTKIEFIWGIFERRYIGCRNGNFQKNPLFGRGNSATYYYTFIAEAGNWGVHSSYITILLVHGIVGMLLHIAFFVSMVLSFYKRYSQIEFASRERCFIKILYVLCVMLLVNALAESFLFSVENYNSRLILAQFSIYGFVFKI